MESWILDLANWLLAKFGGRTENNLNIVPRLFGIGQHTNLHSTKSGPAN